MKQFKILSISLFLLSFFLSCEEVEPDKCKVGGKYTLLLNGLAVKNFTAAANDLETNVSSLLYHVLPHSNSIGTRSIYLDNICPTSPINFQARVKAKSKLTIPRLINIRLYWKTSFGWVESYNYKNMIRTDDVWAVNHTLLDFSRIFDNDNYATISAWIQIDFVFDPKGSTEADLLWAQQNFDSIKLDMDFIYFKK